ncbi:ATPase family AAA domain-containing protein 1-B [Lasiodiplodia theobromae]|uniref:ATPase family AAA domain-containing protein 1-B n=1 Tax=Lasiodiplodia theobromae TaxID=45133 RepID=A0A5N5DE12_9PEZI|nr:ATPase family AAA domain-containing protein 1-B [Lasiodiplodia theobromae]
MLAITPADIWQSHVGNTEKTVKAIFSLARKLHPCIIFIDEADALFPSRRNDDQRWTRNMFNLFLSEWDGLMTDLTSPFVLLATNRPCDLDPAVLRRAPVQIHLEMPRAKERAGILGVLLKDETLGPDITIPKLVELTPHYTGSDLKNLCVAAATECVQEQPKDTWFRVLMERHFLSALKTVGATKMNKSVKSQALRFKADSK